MYTYYAGVKRFGNCLLLGVAVSTWCWPAFGQGAVRAQGGKPTYGVLNPVAGSVSGSSVVQRSSEKTVVQPPRGYQFGLKKTDGPRNQASASAMDTQGAVSVAPPAASATKGGALAPALGTNFQGVQDDDFVPQDPTLAVGPSHIVQGVNSTLRVSNKAGTTLGTAFLESVFPLPTGSSGFWFDPWVVYDHFANRFVVLAIARNSTNTDGWFLVAVSKTGTPSVISSDWRIYHIRNDINFPSTNTAFWSDYAKLGFDNTNFYITANQFSAAGVFQYAKVRRYTKSLVYSGSDINPGAAEWINVRDTNAALAFTIQPAVTFGAPGKAFFVSCNSFAGSQVFVYRFPLTGLAAPLVNSVAVGAWTIPDDARQKGTTTLVATNDARMCNLVYRNGVLATSHGVKRAGFPCACQYILINTPTLTKSLEVTIGHPAAFYYFPAAFIAGDGYLVTAFNFSVGDGATIAARFAGATYTEIALDGRFQSLGLLREGLSANFDGRWGDYNGICRDPSSTSRIWFNAMYAQLAGNAGTWVGSTTSVEFSPEPTGDVRVAMDGGTLRVTGDATANHVRIQKSERGLTISGRDGSLINGKPQLDVSITGSVSLEADLGDGNDDLEIIGVTLGTARLNLGEGNDSVSILLSSIGSLHVNGGDGADTLTTTSSSVASVTKDNVP